MKFDGLPSTNFTVAKYLAKNNDVYYIEHPYTLKDYFKMDKNSPQYANRKEAMKLSSNGLLEKKVEGLNILISYPVLPIAFLPPGKIYNKLLHYNEKIIASRIRKIIKQRNIKEYIFINFYNFHYPNIAQKLHPFLTLYYCVDPIVGDYDRKHGVKAEDKLVRDSDIVICTSKALLKEKKALNPHTYYVPNAADLVAKDDPQFDTVKPTNGVRPVAGYVGAIERRMDYDLLQPVIEGNKNFDFVFTGPVYKEHVPEWFLNHQNVYINAPVAYSEVPKVINTFDVCLIPFKKDDVSSSIFPLKLFEYLGMGKPVIVTDFNNDLKDFTEEVVDYVTDEPSFTSALQSSIHAKPEMVHRRIEVAKNNTWDERIDRLSSVVKHFLEQD